MYPSIFLWTFLINFVVWDLSALTSKDPVEVFLGFIENIMPILFFVKTTICNYFCLQLVTINPLIPPLHP